MNVIDGPIEVLSLVLWSMVVVLAIHYVKILDEAILNEVLQILLMGSWGNRRPLLPVELRFLVKEGEISLAIGWCLVDVLELVSVLLTSTVFVKELFILRVVSGVIFGECHVSSVVPWRHVLVRW